MYPARALTWTVQSGVGHTNEEAITPPSVTRGTTKKQPQRTTIKHRLCLEA